MLRTCGTGVAAWTAMSMTAWNKTCYSASRPLESHIRNRLAQLTPGLVFELLVRPFGARHKQTWFHANTAREEVGEGCKGEPASCSSQPRPGCNGGGLSGEPRLPGSPYSLLQNSLAIQWRRAFEAGTRRGYRRAPRPAPAQILKRRQGAPKQTDEEAAEETVAEVGTAVEVTPSRSTPAESQIAVAVLNPALIVTRDIEWGNVLLGFEQCNKYKVLNERGQEVALLAEDMGSLAQGVARQVLRTRRHFTATVLTPDGSQVLFSLERPAYLVTSTMRVKDAQGEQIGEIHRRFSLVNRTYDLYLDRRQFATIRAPMLSWDFTLTNQEGQTLALIDRNFSGFAKELFTDAGKYVIHFGCTPQQAAEHLQLQASQQQQQQQQQDAAAVSTALANIQPGSSVIPTSSGTALEVVRPLAMEERMIALACAISVDYDFFSQHSHSSGWLPPMFWPMPVPGETAGGGAAAPAPEAAASAQAAESAADAQSAGRWAGMELPPESTSEDGGGSFWGDGGDDGDDGDSGGGFFGTLFEITRDLSGGE